MICPTCREAADLRAPADQHCTSTGGPGAACDCQHRTDRYQQPEQCRAEHHGANMPSGRCDLPEGHDGMHRDESVPPSPLNWAETVATYPTDAPAED